ncbi:MAG: SURF1 family protein [Candidatus Longimicrobiales bacterium M2_2A_002]
MRALDLTGRGIIGTVVVLIVAAVCVRLGLWQLDRRAERTARNDIIAERMAMPPVALTSAPRDTGGLAYRRARVVGRADGDRALILAGRSRNGAPGVNVLSPVRLRTGAVLVNRGWLPAPDAATVDLDAVRLHGPVAVEGVLLPFPDVDRASEPEPFRVTWFRFDGDAIRAQYPYPVAPLYLAATAVVEPATVGSGPGPARAPTDPDGAAAGPRGGPSAAAPAAPIPPGAPELDPGPHLSYAVQWFSFAAIALIGWLVLLVQRARRRPEEQSAPPAGG